MRGCAGCGRSIEARFRFCPFCGVAQRTKLVEFFLPHREVPEDAQKALRVSHYFETDERPAQVRVSIWSEDEAQAAVSLDEAEAARLADFLTVPQRQRRGLLDELRTTLRL